jgi:hypothetical protein
MPQRKGTSMFSANSFYDRLETDEQDILDELRTGSNRFDPPLTLQEIDEVRQRLNSGDLLKAEPCACESPGIFRSGVPEILSRVEHGKLAPGGKVER